MDVNTPCAFGVSQTMVSELLKFPKVHVYAKNKAGSTALDIAFELELVEITRCLEEHIEGCFPHDVKESTKGNR